MQLKTKTLSGAASMYGELAKQGTGGGDYKEPLRASAKMVSANNIRRFDKEVDADGKKWEPLTDKYKKWKLGQYKPRKGRKKVTGKKNRTKSQKIGVLTGVMRTSITSNSAALSVYHLGNHLVQFGSKVAYAGYFHAKRPFIGISKKDIKEMGEIFSIFMERKFYQANKRSKK